MPFSLSRTPRCVRSDISQRSDRLLILLQVLLETDFLPDQTRTTVEELEGGVVPMKLHLPGEGWTTDDPCRAHCHICHHQYAPGDSIVWSSLKYCRHTYCRHCILHWLGSGKKRCPTCHKWFVPPQSIASAKRKLLLSQIRAANVPNCSDDETASDEH